jgi:iron complex outermembrane receptor protein
MFLRPARSWFLSLSLSHNRRAPTEAELFADGPHPGANAFEIGDVSLKAETVNSAEATVRYGDDGGFRIVTHLFVARYDDFIDQRPTGEVEDDLPVFQYLQTDARFVGAEAEASYALWRSGARRLDLEGAVDWVRGKTDLGPPARIPPFSATVRLVYDARAHGGQLEARRVARQDRTAAFETPTDGYTLVNATAWVKPWANRSVRLFIEGRNLGDAQAREHVSLLKDVAPFAGRSIRAGLSAQF